MAQVAPAAAPAQRFCFCGLPCAVKPSWTTNNPSRNFYGCSNYGTAGACNFFEWAEPPLDERSRRVINGLLRRIRMIEHQLEQHQNPEVKIAKKEKFLYGCIILLVLALVFSVSG